MSWQIDSARTRIYMALAESMPVGMPAVAIVNRCSDRRSKKAITTAIDALKVDGWIEQPLGPRTNYKISRKGRIPPLPPPMLKQIVLAAISDVPAGVSECILSADTRVPAGPLRALLTELDAEGLITRIEIPIEHGGGVGWRARTTQLPVVGEIDIDRIHGPADPVQSRAAFSLRDGRLTMAWAGLQLILPQDLTRQLFEHLGDMGHAGARS